MMPGPFRARISLLCPILLLALAGGTWAQKPSAAPTPNSTKTSQAASSQAAGPKQPPKSAESSSPATAVGTPADYSHESAVIEERRESFRFENDGTGTNENYIRVRVQDSAGVQAWGQIVFTYNSAFDKPTVVFVRVHKPDGKIITAGPDAGQDLSSPVERDAPVYSDTRQIHITVPGLNAGDTLEYQVQTASIAAVVPGQFFTAWNKTRKIITLRDSFKVDIPRQRALHLKTDSSISAPEIHDEGERRTYTWSASQLSLPKDEDKKPSKKTKKKSTDDHPDVQLSTFDSWDQVGKWYLSLQQERAVPTDTVRAKAEELTRDKPTQAEKIAAIYDYVSLNIRYVSLSFGVGRYQPHPAADVLANQYGDCKDKATLLEAMLKVIGVDSYPVLASAQAKVDPEIPSPLQFDHEINIVRANGGDLWADSTEGVGPINYLLPQIRDKDVLTMPGAQPASLVKTPAAPPFLSHYIGNLQVTADSSGAAKGEFQFSFQGDVAAGLRAALKKIPQSYYEKLAKGFLKTFGMEDADVSNVSVRGVESLEKPVEIGASFSAHNFVDLSQKKASLNMLVGTLTSSWQPERPEGDDELKLEGPMEDDMRWSVQLPDGIDVTLPVPIQIDKDFGSYQSTYDFSKGKISVEQKLVFKKASVPGSRYDEVDAFANAITADRKQQVALLIASPVEAPSGSLGSKPDADNLYAKGQEAFRQHNFPKAIELDKKALAADPDLDGAWNDLGWAYLNTRSYSEAINAFQKAVAKNPYDPNAYNNLGLAYRMTGQFDDAVQSFQKQIQVNPLDKYAHTNLGSLDLQQENYADARRELETAAKITPDNSYLFISIGEADLGLKDDDAAVASFAHALELRPGPEYWNDIGYVLAVHDARLDMARQYAENAVHAVEAQLIGVTVDSIAPSVARQMASLLAYWDTLGWVKFKQGDLAGAEEYIRAAWALGDHAEVGDHLGQIYEKQGKKKEAIEMYNLAMAGSRPDPQTAKRLAALQGGSKPKTDSRLPTADLSAHRMIKLPNPDNLEGGAEFWMILSDGTKIEATKTIRGDDKVAAVITAAKTPPILPVTIPSGARVKLLLNTVLHCSKLLHECELVIVPADDAVNSAYANASPGQN